MCKRTEAAHSWFLPGSPGGGGGGSSSKPSNSGSACEPRHLPQPAFHASMRPSVHPSHLSGSGGYPHRGQAPSWTPNPHSTVPGVPGAPPSRVPGAPGARVPRPRGGSPLVWRSAGSAAHSAAPRPPCGPPLGARGSELGRGAPREGGARRDLKVLLELLRGARPLFPPRASGLNFCKIQTEWGFLRTPSRGSLPPPAKRCLGPGADAGCPARSAATPAQPVRTRRTWAPDRAPDCHPLPELPRQCREGISVSGPGSRETL